MKLRWLLWVLAIAFVWLVVTRYAELEQLYAILAQGRWQWVLAAALLQVGYYVAYTAVHQSAFATVEVESRLKNLLPIVFASLFLNVAAPTAGASGTALFVEDALRRKQSGIRTAAGILLVYIAMFCAFTVVLAVGMTVLFLYHDLHAYQVVAALLLLLALAGMTGVLLLGLWSVSLLRRILGIVQDAVNAIARRIRRPDFLAADWAEQNTLQFVEAAHEVAAHPRRLLRTVGLALAAHWVNLLCLYAVFLAFDHQVEPGVLVAGYSMAILFLIVSPTPQGIGVVEGVMALVFTSLHVPGTQATVIALAFRGLSFWLPFSLGFFLIERLQIFRGEQRSRARSWTVRAAALMTGLIGTVNVISAATPPVADRLWLVERLSPLEVQVASRLAAALSGFALLLLAGNLWRRARTSWLMTLAILVFAAFSHLFKGCDFEMMILALALAAWLFAQRAHFHAYSDTASPQQGWHALKNAFLFTLIYGLTGFYLLDQHFSVSFSLLAALRQTVLMFIRFYDPGVEPLTDFGRYFVNSIYAVGAVSLGYALFMLFRPRLLRQPSLDQRRRAEAIIQAYGQTPLARFALFSDKSYCFSPSGQSVTAFVAKRPSLFAPRVAIALGDPIGPPDDAPQAIAAFKKLCEQNGWQPAFYQTSPDALAHYQQAGFQTLCIGQEAVVNLENFNLQSHASKPLRTAVNHLIHTGCHTQVFLPPLAGELLDDLQAVSDEWLTIMHGVEKRFSLGSFDDDYIRHCPVMVVQSADGSISAFANAIFVGHADRPRQAAVDLARRGKHVENGAMEFLFAALLQWAKSQGCQTFSLGLSALAGDGGVPHEPSAESALHALFKHISHLYSFRGLHQFKEKFHPEWSPRYLVFPTWASLPQVTLALARAEAGDDLATTLLTAWTSVLAALSARLARRSARATRRLSR